MKSAFNKFENKVFNMPGPTRNRSESVRSSVSPAERFLSLGIRPTRITKQNHQVNMTINLQNQNCFYMANTCDLSQQLTGTRSGQNQKNFKQIFEKEAMFKRSKSRKLNKIISVERDE